MKNRIKKLMLWATVLAMLLTGMSAALADTQSATFVLQVRPKPTEAPAATDVPAAQAPATEHLLPGRLRPKRLNLPMRRMKLLLR